MTKKHFKALAEVLRIRLNEDLRVFWQTQEMELFKMIILEDIIPFCKSQNSQFDPERFKKAVDPDGILF